MDRLKRTHLLSSMKMTLPLMLHQTELKEPHRVNKSLLLSSVQCDLWKQYKFQYILMALLQSDLASSLEGEQPIDGKAINKHPAFQLTVKAWLTAQRLRLIKLLCSDRWLG